jgi:hypothetical protein
MKRHCEIPNSGSPRDLWLSVRPSKNIQSMTPSNTGFVCMDGTCPYSIITPCELAMLVLYTGFKKHITLPIEDWIHVYIFSMRQQWIMRTGRQQLLILLDHHQSIRMDWIVLYCPVPGPTLGSLFFFFFFFFFLLIINYYYHHY